ncbi:mechanosensitive ion channel family protein [Parasphingorhabdus sp.]|uniref:mechanosensitive ion channel family protein n=1 Tax=Parasphingorhabdus sp. TaxID=2709688 RepID=UPI0030032433
MQYWQLGRRFDSVRFAALACSVFMVLVLVAPSAHAQIELPGIESPAEPVDPEPVIEAQTSSPTDAEIEQRIEGIFAEIDALKTVGVKVDAGVVALTGDVPALADADRAESIAARVAGVVTVENALERNLRVADNLQPVTAKLTNNLQKFLNSLPLIGIALAIFILFWLLGRLFSGMTGLWRKIAPNMFMAELMATSIRIIFVIVGLIIALDVLQATALMGAILGGAGVLGLAIGFAIRDTVDNYISSIMLSIRQPFRANDHVMIGDREGHVIRLTSRATILMTLDGNHLRIPNSTVFKAEILNYSTNPERRFDFELGVDAEDDPLAAMAIGLEALRKLAFVLDDPDASARLEQVGDSNIVIRFLGWIDQTHSDFYKARSIAIRAVMTVLEAEGFGLPEPIYRLRFDSGAPLEIARAGKNETGDIKAESKPARKAPQPDLALEDVSLENDIGKKVAEERAAAGEQDILDEARPIE